MDIMRGTSVASILNFARLLGKLKHTRRAGWERHQVPNCESVADHMYRMSVLSMLIPTSGELSRDKCIRLSLVHDIAECIVGDITPADNIPKEEKHKKELGALQDIQKLVPDEFAEELMTLWLEYEGQSTPEAKFVKDLDKFDMVMQAHEYEEAQKAPGSLQEFFNSVEGHIKHPSVLSWFNELKQTRDK